VSGALQIVLHTTQESLNLWVESNKFQLTRLAEDPRLVFLTVSQLRRDRNRKALLKSHTLQELRDFLQYGRDQFGQARYFIISPDFINIASMRDEKIGARNLIANQALDLLNKAFLGEAVMVPPIWSDIPLMTPLDGKNKKSAAMFFVAPIKNVQEKVIAVIARRVDPSIDFTRLIQLGRIGKSGETYALGQYGKFLSESRFDEDLVKAGMLDKGETSILTVSVRDPGGDMTRGYIPAVPRYQQPLTLMAQQATKGKAGLNVEGYRDYRGVRVYGAWLWDDKLGVGLATEIDEADALGTYYTMRTVILTVLGITVLLALGALVFALLIDVRANRALQKSHDELEHRVEERTAELKENQARLEQAEEHSRLLLESAQDGIFGVGEDGLVNFINPAGLKMLGFNIEEVIGQKIHPLIHHTRPDGSPYPIEECPMNHSLTQGTIGSRDDEVLWRKDGTSFHVEYTSVPIRKNGSIAGTVVVFRDITDRKQAEQAIRENRAKYRNLVENANCIIFQMDTQGNVTFFNRFAQDFFGYSEAEILGRNVVGTIVHTSDSAGRNLEIMIQDLVTHPDRYADNENENIRRNGESVWVAWTNRAIYDEESRLSEILCIGIDRTEQKKTEEALRESRATARGLLDATQESLLLLNKEGILIAVNQTAARRFQRTPEELIGTHHFDKLPESVLESRKAHFQKVLQTGEPDDFEDVRDGTVFHNIYYPVRDTAGAIMGVAIFGQDITERKRAEEALKRNVDELERFSKVAFGREKKMIQLKQEINELMIQLGKAEKYKIVS
jgi:PAS domain S-box-containing protein